MSEIVTQTATAPAVAPKQTRKPSASPTVKAGGDGDKLPDLKQPAQRHHIMKEGPLNRGEIEADALLGKLMVVASELSAVGPETLVAIYQHLGRMADKFGRSQVIPTVAAQLAMHNRQATFSHRIQLAQTANKAVIGDSKPVFAVKAKAGAGDGQASYKMNLPAQLNLDVS
jgi:hypothetical protein